MVSRVDGTLWIFVRFFVIRHLQRFALITITARSMFVILLSHHLQRFALITIIAHIMLITINVYKDNPSKLTGS